MNVLLTTKLDKRYALGSTLPREVPRRLIQPLRQEMQVSVMPLTHTVRPLGGQVVMIVLHMLPLRRIGDMLRIVHLQLPIYRGRATTHRRQLLARRIPLLA